jgi:2-iminobutanoate/2-iminopropanoate deaminase
MSDDGILDPPFPMAPRAVKRGGIIYVQGQVGVDDDGYIVGEDDAEAQADQCFANIRKCLALHGADLEHVAQLTCYLTDALLYPGYSASRKRHFPDPARGPATATLLAGGLLLRGAGMELVAQAVVE